MNIWFVSKYASPPLYAKAPSRLFYLAKEAKNMGHQVRLITSDANHFTNIPDSGKLYNNEWKDGTCAYYWFTNNVFGAPLYLQKFYNLLTLSSFTPIITWSVIILELGLFACILATNKNIKKTFLILGLLFHFSIAITHGLVTFFCSMAAALILYLDDENKIYQYCARKFNYLRNGNR